MNDLRRLRSANGLSVDFYIGRNIAHLSVVPYEFFGENFGGWDGAGKGDAGAAYSRAGVFLDLMP
jgi:hypothetical protein